MLTGTIPARDLARKLRRTMSLPEVMLWQQLRLRPGGFKFRRQHPAGDYILDFFCPAAALAVEVDGAIHDCSARGEFDLRRDAWLAGHGIRSVRVPATEVLKSALNVVEAVVAICSERVALPLHHAVKNGAVPLPEAGEDFRTEAHAWNT